MAKIDKACHQRYSPVMATTTMNISLPDSMRAFVDERLDGDGYGSASEYVRELIRSDQKRVEQEKLEKLLLKRLESKSVKNWNVEELRSELARRTRER